MTTRTRRSFQIAVTLAALAGVMVVGAYLLLVAPYHALAPPDDANTLAAFQKFVPRPYAIVRATHKGTSYIVIFGKQPLLSEQPAGYLFDDGGRLVDWSHEALDYGHLAEFWELARREIRAGRRLTYEDVILDR